MLQKTKMTLLRLFAIVAFVVLFAFASISLASCSSSATGISKMEIIDGHLYVTYTDSEEAVDLGLIVGEDGKDGVDGTDGTDGKDGVDGTDGTDGKDGVDGTDGTDGTDGKDGVDGTDGTDGTDGKDGVDGADGVGISEIYIDDTTGMLVIVYTDSTTEKPHQEELDISGIVDCDCCKHEADGYDLKLAYTITAVDCGTDGVGLYYCSNCGTAIIQTIPATGEHTYDYDNIVWTWADDYTCTATVTCSVCGAEYNYEADVTHSTTTEATCDTEGEETYYASITVDGTTYDGTTKTAVIEATGNHVFTVNSIEYVVTVGSDGYIYVDGALATWADVEMLGGTIVSTDGLCTEDASAEGLVCDNGGTVTGLIAAASEHTGVAGTYVNATCEDDGYTPYECSVCGYTWNVTDEGTATGHSYDAGVYTDPTCEDDGYTTYTCETCGNSYDEVDEGTATGHTITYNGEEYKITVDENYYIYINDSTTAATRADLEAIGITGITADCTVGTAFESGTKCETCNQALVGMTAAGEHDYVTTGTTVDPTCTENGYTIYECSVCGATANLDEVPATGHDYDVVWDWTDVENGNVYVTITCLNGCGTYDVVDGVCTVVAGDYVSATCTENGYTPYTATYEFTDNDGTVTLTETYNLESTTDVALGYHTTDATNADETVRFVIDSDHYIYLYSDQTTKLDRDQFVAIGGTMMSTDATKLGYGYITCELCGETFTVILIPTETAHTYTAEWTWTDDYSAATVTLTCSNCGHVEVQEVNSTSALDGDNNTVYTVTYTYTETGDVFTATKTIYAVVVDTPATVSISASAGETYASAEVTIATSGYYAVEFDSTEAYIVITSADGKYGYSSYDANKSGAKVLKAVARESLATVNYLLDENGDPALIPAGTVLYITIVLYDLDATVDAEVSFTVITAEYTPATETYDYTLTNDGLTEEIVGDGSYTGVAYTIYVEEAGTYTITVSGDSADIGIEIANEVDWSGEVTATLAAGDVITLYACETGTVTITAEDAEEPVDEMEVGKEYTVTLDSDNYAVETTITITEAGYYTVTLTGDSAYIYVIDDEQLYGWGTYYITSTNYIVDWTITSSDVPVSIPAGTVLNVYITYYGDDTAEITALIEKADAPTTGGDEDTYDYTLTSAGLVADLVGGSSYTGVVYTIYVSEAGKYTIIVADEADIGIEVGDSVDWSGSVTATLEAGDVITLYACDSGTVTIAVYEETASTAYEGTIYNLSDYYTLSSATDGDELIEGILSVVGGTLYVNTSCSIDDTSNATIYEGVDLTVGILINNTSRYLTFVLSADAEVTFYYGLGNANSVMVISDSNGDPVFTSAAYISGNDTYDVYSGVVTLSKGTYTIAITGGNARLYSIAVLETSTSGGEDEDTTTLALGENTLEPYVDYTYTAETAGTYTITLTSGDIDYACIYAGEASYDAWESPLLDVQGDGKYSFTVTLAVGDVLTLYVDGSDGLTLTITAPEESTTTAIDFGGQEDAVSDTDTWYYWNDQNWVSSNTVINSATVNDDGVVTVDFTATAWEGYSVCWYAVQLFYKNSELTEGTSYDMTIMLLSDTAGDVTVNGTVVTLEANVAKTVTITYTETSGSASISIQFGNETAATAIEAGTIIISNIGWAEHVELNTALLIGENSVSVTAEQSKGTGIDYTMTVEADGTYTFTVAEDSDAYIEIYVDGDKAVVLGNTIYTYDLELTDGQEVVCTCYTYSYEAATYTLTISYAESEEDEPTVTAENATATLGSVYGDGYWVELEFTLTTITPTDSNYGLTSVSEPTYTVYYYLANDSEKTHVAVYNMFTYGDSAYHVQLQMSPAVESAPSIVIVWEDADGNIVATAVYAATVASVDFTTMEATEYDADGEFKDVYDCYGEETGFTVIGKISSGTETALVIKEQNKVMSLNFSGACTYTVDEETEEVTVSSALRYYLEAGTYTITISYFNGNDGRFAVVLGSDGTLLSDDVEDDELTTSDKAIYTREITITLTEAGYIYIGSDHSGLYIGSVTITESVTL